MKRDKLSLIMEFKVDTQKETITVVIAALKAIPSFFKLYNGLPPELPKVGLFHLRKEKYTEDFTDKIFDVLYRSISSEWKLQGDIPYPFGDRRECLVNSSWVIDLDNSLVTLRKKNSIWYQIHLEETLQNRPASIADMKILTPLPPQQNESNIHFTNPTWEVDPIVSPRLVVFIGRLLNDFAHQWRHVLRSRYNKSTFQQLACAIIRIITLDFEIKEITGGRTGTGRVVWLADLPSWKPIYEYIVPLGRVTIIICQYLTHAMKLMHGDFGLKRARNEAACMSITYIVMSVREVFLYKAWTCDDHEHVYTKPEPLFNGTDNLSEKALAYLLLAAPSDNIVSSLLHCLPLEVQDMIIDNMYPSRVKSALIGCLLSLGSPYRWQGPYGPISREEVFCTRTGQSAVESVFEGDVMF